MAQVDKQMRIMLRRQYNIYIQFSLPNAVTAWASLVFLFFYFLFPGQDPGTT